MRVTISVVEYCLKRLFIFRLILRTLSDRPLLLIRADEQARQMPAVGGIFRPATAPVPPTCLCDCSQCFNQSSQRKRRNEGEGVKETTLQVAKIVSFRKINFFFFNSATYIATHPLKPLCLYRLETAFKENRTTESKTEKGPFYCLLSGHLY